LVDFKGSLLNEERIIQSQAKSLIKRNSKLFKKIYKYLIFENNNNSLNINYLTKYLFLKEDPKILVIGGGEIGSGFNKFYNIFKNNITSFDIYYSENIDFISDAHSIPFCNNYFDLVIIQAVLEHVLNPVQVVSEINRVLINDGIVYAETPFMQQVHEGPFDFTRFTDSGHRFLFKDFITITSGYTSGVGTSLIWSLDFFISGLFRTRYAGKLIRIFLFWIKYFDKLIPFSFNLDGACGVYFMGVKSATKMKNYEIINYYQGNQKPI
jgi:SAM-dependent methyltransferase